MKLNQLILMAATWLGASMLTKAACPPTQIHYCVDLPANTPVPFVHNLQAGALPLSSILPAVPGMQVFTYSGGWTAYMFDADDLVWTPSDPTIARAQGMIIIAPVNTSLTFYATNLPPPNLPLNLAPNVYHLIGRQWVGIGTFQSVVGFNPSGCPGAEVLRLLPNGNGNWTDLNDPGAWAKYTHDGTTWSPTTPTWNIGEAVMVKVTSPCSGVAAFTASLVLPGEVGKDCPVSVLKVYGAGFQSGATVTLKKSGQPDIAATSVTLMSATYAGFGLEATVDVSGAVTGDWDVEVVNPGGASQVIPAGLIVTDLGLDSTAPNHAGRCSTINIVTLGRGICPGATVKLTKAGQTDIVGTGVEVLAGYINASFNLVGVAVGSWDVVVENPGGHSASLAGYLTIGSGAINTVAPNQVTACAQFTLYAQGHSLCSGGSIKLVKSGQPDIVGTTPVADSKQAQLSSVFDMQNAAGGAWDVVYTDMDGNVTTLPGAVTVVLATLTSVVPDRVGNCGLVTLNIGGTALVNASVKLTRSGQADIPGTILRTSGLGIEAQFNLAGAALGTWNVVGCGNYTLPGALTVAPLAVNLITPVSGKACAAVSIDISGNCFASGATVKLKKSGSPSITGASTVNGSGLIKAVFDLTGATAGLWDIEVTNPNGDVATLPAKFTVVPCTGCDVGVTVYIPSRVGAGRMASASVCYVNNGSTTLNNVAISVTDIPADATVYLWSTSPTATIASPFGLPQTISFVIPTLAPGQAGCYYFSLVFPSVRPPVQVSGKVTSPCLNTHVGQCEVVASHDPNDKQGHSGNGANHFIQGTETLPYVIQFENKATATAPAQEVFITDYLNPARLDLATFSLGTVSFGTHTITPPSGLSSWTGYVPHDVDGNAATTTDQIIVKITAALVTNPADANYGRLTWALASLDPLTGVLPTDPLLGFLAPNVTAPQGEGSVSYTVKPLANLVTGDDIGNHASITFDLNPPILTPVWLNTVDKTAPVSSVDALPPLAATSMFTVNWSGTDAVSGIASYDVFVSDNGGPFTAWLTATTTTSGAFAGSPGHEYRFYTVATDLVGHVESAPVSPDAVTVVRPLLSITRSGGNVTLTWEGAGVLQSASAIEGPWADVSSANNPYTKAMTTGNEFFRLRP